MFPIEQLPNELLVHIFRLMNPVDRLRVERVCTRWNILAKNCGWFQFNKLSINSFPTASALNNVPGKNELKWLFSRCGRYIRELDMAGPLLDDGTLSDLLPMLANLGHLNLANNEEIFAGLIKVLSECQGIESPATALKFLEYSDAAYHQELFRQIAEQKIQLHGLGLLSISLDEVMLMSLRRIDCSRMKYFSIRLDLGSELCFSMTLAGMPNLVALEVLTQGATEFLDEVVEAIVQGCPKLKLLKLVVLNPEELVVSSLNNLTAIKLSAVSIQLCGSGGSHDLSNFLKQVSSHGLLKFFDTNASLSNDSICQAMRECKNLNRLFWDETNFSFNELFDVLDAIHAGKAPVTNGDESMLRISADQNVSHPWIINITGNQLHRIRGAGLPPLMDSMGYWGL
uniref:F-box domain-containing protein n=1 Tax=Ditylenchus dipsaci TaxID=166011 RepID=A0A915ECH8_9BILA